MRADVGLQEPAMRLLEGRTPLHKLPVPWLRQRHVSALGGAISKFGRGGGGSLESGAALKSVSGDNAKITTAGKHNHSDVNDGVEDGQEGGQGGARGGSAGVRAHGGGPVDQGSIRGLVALQQWILPQWVDQGLPGVTGRLENPGNHARKAI